MKIFLNEIFDPIRDYYKIHIKSEKTIGLLIPVISGVLCFLVGTFATPSHDFEPRGFSEEILNQSLTMLTLFISFSMAYLSILITSDSKNVDELKKAESEKYFLDEKACTLYQVLASEITYTIVFEIFFMVILLVQRMLLCLCGAAAIKVILSMDIAFFVHTLLMMLVVVKNIYFSFWRSK